MEKKHLLKSKHLKSSLRKLSYQKDYTDYKIYKSALNHFIDNRKDYREIEAFNKKINLPFDEIERYFIGTLFPDLPLEIENKVMFVYTRYYFVYNNILQILKKEKVTLDEEKSGWIIQQYLNHILYKKPFILYLDNNKEETKNLIHGTNEDWIFLIDSLHDLYHGRSEKFIEALKKL